MHTCIYTRKTFTESTGEHILQNSLGARWTSEKIACNEIQKIFGESIDSDLAEGLSPFRTLLNTGDGRKGSVPSINNIESSDGHQYHMGPGGRPILAKPAIDATKDAEGKIQARIMVAREKDIPWAMHELNKLFPKAKFNAEQVGALIKGTGYVDSSLKIQIKIGGQGFFRGLCKAAFNLLGESRPEIALNPCLDRCREFIAYNKGISDDFIGWVPSPDPLPLPRLANSDHFIGVWGRSGKINGIVQFFGNLPFMVHLGAGCNVPDFEISYLVNPNRDTTPAESRNIKFSPDQLPRFDDCAHKPGPTVWPVYTEHFSRIIREHQSRARSAAVGEIVESVLGSLPESHIITEKDTSDILEKLMPLIEHLVRQSHKRAGEQI